MNIYKVSRTGDVGPEEYESMVVIADGAGVAKSIHPDSKSIDTHDEFMNLWDPKRSNPWVNMEEIISLKAELIGTIGPIIPKEQVVLASKLGR